MTLKVKSAKQLFFSLKNESAFKLHWFVILKKRVKYIVQVIKENSFYHY